MVPLGWGVPLSGTASNGRCRCKPVTDHRQTQHSKPADTDAPARTYSYTSITTYTALYCPTVPSQALVSLKLRVCSQLALFSFRETP